MNTKILAVVIGVSATLSVTSGAGDYTYYTTNGDIVTITGYTGPGGTVVIPETIEGLPVTTISHHAFYENSSLTGVTIPSSVTNIGSAAFMRCQNLGSVAVPDSVLSLGTGVFLECSNLVSATIGNGITEIKDYTFQYCNLTYATIGSNVASIGALAFYAISGSQLKRLYFRGNPPAFVDGTAFWNNSSTIVFYRQETTGWGATFAGFPTVLWTARIITDDGNFGVDSDGFGFTVRHEMYFSSVYNYSSVVKACTNLSAAEWIPVGTNIASGIKWEFDFNDSQWTNHPVRFYGVDMP